MRIVSILFVICGLHFHSNLLKNLAFTVSSQCPVCPEEGSTSPKMQCVAAGVSVSLGKMSPTGVSDQERNCVWLFLKKKNENTKGWNDVIHVWDHPVPIGPLLGLMAWTLNMADIRCAGWEIIHTDTVWVFWTHCQLNWRFFLLLLLFIFGLFGWQTS